MWRGRSENPNSADHCARSNTLPHPEGWATDPSRFAIAAARRFSRPSKKYQVYASGCASSWYKGFLDFCVRLRLRDDERKHPSKPNLALKWVHIGIDLCLSGAPGTSWGPRGVQWGFWRVFGGGLAGLGGLQRALQNYS